MGLSIYVMKEEAENREREKKWKKRDGAKEQIKCSFSRP